jgi:hypothetical protein
VTNVEIGDLVPGSVSSITNVVESNGTWSITCTKPTSASAPDRDIALLKVTLQFKYNGMIHTVDRDVMVYVYADTKTAYDATNTPASTSLDADATGTINPTGTGSSNPSDNPTGSDVTDDTNNTPDDEASTIPSADSQSDMPGENTDTTTPSKSRAKTRSSSDSREQENGVDDTVDFIAHEQDNGIEVSGEGTK